MKRAVTKNFLNSRTTDKIKTALILLFVLFSFFNPLVSDAMCQAMPLAAAGSQSAASKSAKEIEYEVKAAFIYNFMKFIEWPKAQTPSESKDQNAPKPMVIGVLGTNPFGSAFQPILDKEVHGRKTRLVNIPSFELFYKKASDRKNAFAAYQAKYRKTISNCDVLFICDSEKNHLKELIILTADNMVLTVSDLPGFVKSEGMIGFVKHDNKIRFEINLDATQKENIKIRSQLLTLAKEVYETKK